MRQDARPTAEVRASSNLRDNFAAEGAGPDRSGSAAAVGRVRIDLERVGLEAVNVPARFRDTAPALLEVSRALAPQVGYPPHPDHALAAVCPALLVERRILELWVSKSRGHWCCEPRPPAPVVQIAEGGTLPAVALDAIRCA